MKMKIAAQVRVTQFYIWCAFGYTLLCIAADVQKGTMILNPITGTRSAYWHATNCWDARRAGRLKQIRRLVGNL